MRWSHIIHTGGDNSDDSDSPEPIFDLDIEQDALTPSLIHLRQYECLRKKTSGGGDANTIQQIRDALRQLDENIVVLQRSSQKRGADQRRLETVERRDEVKALWNLSCLNHELHCQFDRFASSPETTSSRYSERSIPQGGSRLTEQCKSLPLLFRAPNVSISPDV